MYCLSKLLKLKIYNGNKYFISSDKTKVMRYLNVAEKRDAAKNIALHLSGRNCQMENGLWKFDAEVFREKSNMIMTSVSGHLLNYIFVNGAVKNWQSCEPSVLFEEPVAKICPKDYEKIKKTLQIQILKCDGLIIWTDCDREGENIGFEIIEVCKYRKPNIQVYRAKFSEITSESVTRALNNLERPNPLISQAVDIRQQLDLRIGAAFTRLQSLRLKNIIPQNTQNNVISYGSCQFPTLGFVVERYKAIANFVIEPFWKLQVTHNYNNLSTIFSWDRVRLFDESVCKILHNVCLEDGTAKVVDVNTKPKSKWRPLPLDTIELEKLASRKLNINAKETMRIAEKLYIAGIISYPRTETNKFSKDINLKKLVELQRNDPNWGGFAQNILTYGPNPRQGNKSDEAHPPIHPTKYVSDLNGNEKRLYEFIVRSFLACCSKNATGKETIVTVNIGDEIFRANGLIVEERNYLDVYPYDKWSTKEINAYQTGTTFIPTKIEMEEGKTSPPQLLTEADLIALMEKHGIGTDATHADHIEKIKSRGYVVFQENNMSDDNTRQRNTRTFMPTKLGMGLVKAYDEMSLTISKPNLRAEFEADLKLICEGRKAPEIVLREQISKYKEIYRVIENNVNKLTNTLKNYFPQTAGGNQPQTTESTVARNYPNGSSNSVASSVSSNINRQATSNLPSSSNSIRILCLCNQPARQFTSKKRNQNYGKQFYKCYKDDGCKFFKWDESTPAVQNPNLPSTSRNSSVNDTTTNRRNNGGAPRRCSRCRQLGHNIKNCPNNFQT